MFSVSRFYQKRSARRHRQKYKHELEQPRVKWIRPEWNGSVICMTSANVKFGAEIHSRALNSPHRKTSFASFVLPSTFSGKFTISCFYFPQLMFCVLTEARVFTLNVLNLAVFVFVLVQTAKLYVENWDGSSRRSLKCFCHNLMIWIYCEMIISGGLWPIMYRILRQ